MANAYTHSSPATRYRCRSYGADDSAWGGAIKISALRACTGIHQRRKDQRRPPRESRPSRSQALATTKSGSA